MAKEMSKMQKSNQRYVHNERLTTEQEHELFARSPLNPSNKKTLAENGFHLIIVNADSPVVKQILAHA